MPSWIREIEMDADDERRLAVRPEHRDYVAALHERGSIRLSGPLASGDGAVIVYRAEDEAAARALVEQDPYVREGVVRELSLREWDVVIPED